MITDPLDAWIIHKYWSGDTSVRVIFFTEQYGLVNCLYKGGRAPKKQALLQPFTPLWLVLGGRGESYYLRQLEAIKSSISLPGQILFAGLYVNELIFHALRQHDTHPHLYNNYQQTLEALSTSSDRLTLEAILRRFEWALLTASGYSMSLTHDVLSGEAICSGSTYQFNPGEGFILAESGIKGAHIIDIAEDKLTTPAVLTTAKQIMRRAIAHALDGREIRTRQLYS